MLNLCLIEIGRVIRRWGRVVVRMADVINTTSTIVVVRRFDVIATHVCRLVADLLHAWGQFFLGDRGIGVIVAGVAFGSGAAKTNLVEASVEHVVCKLGIRIDGVVVCFDTVGIIDGKLRIILGLNGLINDTIDYTERVELERVARHAPVLDFQILVVEVAVECRTVVTSVRLSEKIEFSCRTQRSKLRIEFRNSSQQGLENMLFISSALSRYIRRNVDSKTHPYRNSGKISGINGTSVEWFRKWPSASCRPIA